MLSLKTNQDRLLRAGASRQILEGISGACQSALDGPHLLLETRTDRCAKAVARFAELIVA
jgi:hypothetical protein